MWGPKWGWGHAGDECGGVGVHGSQSWGAIAHRGQSGCRCAIPLSGHAGPSL